MIVLKLSFHEMKLLCIIIQRTAQELEYSTNALVKLGGEVYKDLLKRLLPKVAIEFYSDKKVKLNIKECLALKALLMWRVQQEDNYSRNLRYKVFEQVDRKIM